jgi:hypothetical protein
VTRLPLPACREQKLQKHNALLEARLQLQRLNSEGIPHLQSAQHSHGSNTPGAASDAPSSEKTVSGVTKRGVGRPESAGRVSGGASRPRSTGGSRGNGAVSSQPTGGKGARETPPGTRAQPTQGKRARRESPGEGERISVYTGQIKSGGSVAGMYDPKYTSRSVIESTNGHRFSQSPQRNNVRTSETVERGSDSGGREGGGEEHPSWLFADGVPSRRSSERSRGSEPRAGDASGRLGSHSKSTAGNKGGEAAEARVIGNERQVSVSGSGHRGSSAMNGLHEPRRTSDATRGKPIRTLRAQGSLEDLPAAASGAPDSGRSRGPSAREEIEVLRERIASGTATPSGRPASSSLPDEVAQKEQEHYQQLYQPTGNSLAQRRRQGLGFTDGWSEEAPARLGRTSSKLEELLMRVEKEGLQASGDDVQRKSRVAEAERLASEGRQPAQGLEGLDSPQGGFMGERRSQPHEEAPRVRAQQTLSPAAERPSSFLSIAGGVGLTSLLNGGFLSEGLGVSDARSSTGFGSADSASSGSAGLRRADSLEGAFPKAAEGDGRKLSKSKVGREDKIAETRVTGRAASTSQDSSRPSSARSTSNSVTNPATARANPHRPSSATASIDSHVSVAERPASASNVSRGNSGSAGVEDPMRRSHVALSGQGRASTDGQKRLERSASGSSLIGALNRSGSKSGIFRIASPLQRNFQAEDGLGSTGQSSSSETGLGKGLGMGLDSSASEDFETPTLAQERARLAGANLRADRPPAYVPSKGLERARSVSPGGRRRIEDRFAEETREVRLYFGRIHAAISISS